MNDKTKLQPLVGEIGLIHNINKNGEREIMQRGVAQIIKWLI